MRKNKAENTFSKKIGKTNYKVKVHFIGVSVSVEKMFTVYEIGTLILKIAEYFDISTFGYNVMNL